MAKLKVILSILFTIFALNSIHCQSPYERVLVSINQNRAKLAKEKKVAYPPMTWNKELEKACMAISDSFPENLNEEFYHGEIFHRFAYREGYSKYIYGHYFYRWDSTEVLTKFNTYYQVLIEKPWITDFAMAYKKGGKYFYIMFGTDSIQNFYSLSFVRIGKTAVEGKSGVNGDTLLKLVNNIRKTGCQCGNRYMDPVPPLKYAEMIEGLAQWHSEDMASRMFLTHDGFLTDEPYDRARLYNISFLDDDCGENCAMGQNDEAEVFNDWKKSPGHCKNMMNKNYTSFVVARREDYWTMALVGHAKYDDKKSKDRRISAEYVKAIYDKEYVKIIEAKLTDSIIDKLNQYRNDKNISKVYDISADSYLTATIPLKTSAKMKDFDQQLKENLETITDSRFLTYQMLIRRDSTIITLGRPDYILFNHIYYYREKKDSVRFHKSGLIRPDMNEYILDNLKNSLLPNCEAKTLKEVQRYKEKHFNKKKIKYYELVLSETLYPTDVEVYNYLISNKESKTILDKFSYNNFKYRKADGNWYLLFYMGEK